MRAREPRSNSGSTIAGACRLPLDPGGPSWTPQASPGPETPLEDIAQLASQAGPHGRDAIGHTDKQTEEKAREGEERIRADDRGSRWSLGIQQQRTTQASQPGDQVNDQQGERPGITREGHT